MWEEVYAVLTNIGIFSIRDAYLVEAIEFQVSDDIWRYALVRIRPTPGRMPYRETVRSNAPY